VRQLTADSNVCYNPLNNDLDPYPQAFNIASIITSIWGKGKEPLLAAVPQGSGPRGHRAPPRSIRICHVGRHFSHCDLFRKLGATVGQTSGRVVRTCNVVITRDDYDLYGRLLARLGFTLHRGSGFRPVCGRNGKSSLSNPVHFGQLAHEPASGTSVSSCLSNGTDASCGRMLDSIHAANNAECVFMKSAAA